MMARFSALPRCRTLDLKEFFELYPGLIGWVVLDLGMAAAQLAKIGYVTNSMILVRRRSLAHQRPQP